jgi:tetratricopeptide (TPR) repeat protein
LFTANPLFADYSGHVASFKNEKNAVKFVAGMKAKGLVAFYKKVDVPERGELYRSYIGKYKTRLQARKALAKLKKAGVIDFFQIQKTAAKDGDVVVKKMETRVQKVKPARQKPVASKETIYPASGKQDKEIIKNPSDLLKKPQTLKPDLNPMEHYNLGIENIAKGKYEAALDDISRAISEDDRFTAAYNKRCFVFYMMGNTESAIKDCTTAIISKPDFAEAYYNRGLANQAANQIESAVADYGRAIAIDSNYKAAYAKRGYMYYLSGHSKQAIDDYTRAIEIKPDDDEAYFNRALAYHDSGNMDKALADVEKACLLKNEQACRIAEDMSKK